MGKRTRNQLQRRTADSSSYPCGASYLREIRKPAFSLTFLGLHLVFVLQKWILINEGAEIIGYHRGGK